MSNSNENTELQEIVTRLSNALSLIRQVKLDRDKALKDATSGQPNVIQTANQFSKALADFNQAIVARNKAFRKAASGPSNSIQKAHQAIVDGNTALIEAASGLSNSIQRARQAIEERNKDLIEAASGPSNSIQKAHQAIEERYKDLIEAASGPSNSIQKAHQAIEERYKDLIEAASGPSNSIQKAHLANKDLIEEITNFSTKYKNILQQISTKSEVEKIRIYYLGKKGELTALFRKLGTIDMAERKQIAPLLNDLKTQITLMNSERMQELVEKEEEERIENEWLDVTLPGRSRQQGSIHPVSQTIDQAVAIFSEIGFSYAEGPQIETDWYNFDALNIPPEHPARQEHDTFFIRGDSKTEKNPNVLRTHTSPVQIRSMTKQGVPIRIIAPGRVYRCDYDQTHTPMFHQIEGLAIDKNLNMAHLKWTLEEFCRTFFEVDNVELRFRASHFPFTEPSAEVDIRCSWERDLLKIGEGDDWLEILGCGMVHPNVLTASGVDKDQYQGFAFGMGLDRIAMLKYGIPDLRSFFESDIRWLRHYGFLPVDVPSLHSGLSL